MSLEQVDEKATTIPLELLSQSIRHEGKYGNALETKPVQIWNLIDNVRNILEKASMNYSLDDIYVQKRSSAAMLNDADRNAGFNKYHAPISRWKFDKVITSFNMPNISQAGRNAKIGLTLNENGMVVAYGMNVHVCQNFSVLGGTILRTYSFDKTPASPWEFVKMKVSEWTQNLDQLFRVQNEIASRMQEKEVNDERTIQKVVGILYQNAIRQAYFRGEHTPFDTSSLSQFVQEMIRQRKEEEKIANVWELYNWGTSVMKPGIVDISDISNTSDSYAKFLMKEFAIDVKDLSVVDDV